MAISNSTFQLLVLLFLLLLLTKSPFLEAFKSNSSVENFKIGCIEKEREALLKFKEGLKDPSGWLSSWVGDDCCNWVGVGCSNQSGNIFSLDLRSLDYCGSVQGNEAASYEKKCLGGTLNPSVLNLTFLNYLDLSFNNFQGNPIPESIGSLKSLRHLDLSDASSAGKVPLSLGNLSNLQYLDLSFNSYDKNLWISDLNWISGLSSLQRLGLGGINLSKKETTNWLQNISYSLPFINFTSLSYLDLPDNNFRSQIPQWLFNISTLETVQIYNSELSDLSGNNISGEIKEFIEALSGCSNSTLEYLSLDSNKLSGSLPDSLRHFKYLKQLQLPVNSFTGPLPSTIANLSHLKVLSVSFNVMNGTISESIGQLTELIELDLYGNSWKGVISENLLHNLTQLTDFYLSSTSNSLVFNARHDWIPSFSLETFAIRDCQLGPAFPSWLRTQVGVTDYIILSNVNILDAIPDLFWRSISPRYGLLLDLSHNQLRGELPKLFLTNNSLSGPMPLNIGNEMPMLEYLDVSRNLINGSIPPSMSKMRFLTYLDLSNNYLDVDLSNNIFSGGIPGSICSLPSLVLLKLSHNNLSAELSVSLQDCTSLSLLDLGKNRFFGTISLTENLFNLSYLTLPIQPFSLSGSIPRCLGNKKALKYIRTYNPQPLFFEVSFSEHVEKIVKGRQDEYTKIISLLNIIDLSGNNLTGEIPEDITNLLALGHLNLARNQLTGKIPEKFRNLQQLESLDLSSNHFHHLNLSYNNLSGPILTTNQFQTFNDPSIYEGNPYLCGPPLTTNCSLGLVDTEDKAEEVEDEDGSEKFWLYVGMALGFILGFWAVCGTLIIKRSWRQAYFRLVDETKDKLLVFIAVYMARLRRKVARQMSKGTNVGQQ
ncbi:hypothetical protein ACOSP7_018664 [Xanthoceras sorbifolium]